MLLKHSSVTGADCKVNAADLVALSQRFPFVEWSFLYSPDRAGVDVPRCPTVDKIKEFRDVCGKHGHVAMHLCESALKDFINGDPATFDLMQGFPRIQLNLEFGSAKGLYHSTHEITRALAERVQAAPQWRFILQCPFDQESLRLKDEGLLPLFKNAPNVDILFDSSAGSGTRPKSWPAPLDGFFCGYAGGITPESYEEDLEKMRKVVPVNMAISTDLESGVRTDDIFDLIKATRILEIGMLYAPPPTIDLRLARPMIRP
jgi:hypothetical protein